jgi:hypothetical protein
MQDKLAFFEQIIFDLLKTIPKTEQKLYDSILGLLDEFDQTKGRFDPLSDDYATLTGRVEEIVVDAVNKSGYKTATKDFLKEFDKIEALNRQMHKDINKIDINNLSKYFKQAKEGTITTAIDLFEGAGVLNNQVIVLRKTLTDNIFLGNSIAQTRQALKEQILGNEERLGYLERNVTQIARDTVYGYNGLINGIVQEKYEMKYLRYVGSLVTDSRVQCRKWVNNKNGIMKMEDLPDQIAWALRSGQGMVPITNSTNFFIYRGGPNCRHDAIPSLLGR